MIAEQSLSQQAYAQLRREILTCTLPPGQVLSERELAQRYAMSKTPVREALGQLDREGLVRRLPGRGYLVSPITVEDVHNLFDLRLILEVAAAERAARRLSPDHVAVLREMADVTYCLDDPQSHVAFLDANRTFHLTLAAGSGNRRLADELGTVMLEMDRLFHLGLRVRDSAQEMKQEHQDVVAALEAGDVDAVKDLVAQQILTSQTRVMEAILRGHIQSIHIGE